MDDEPSDVTKALAAFGAPSIRYHSFGQAHVRPSSVVLPRKGPPPSVPVVQAEPLAAPEATRSLRTPPDAVRPLFQTSPAPPRPLAEWAAPAPIAAVAPAAAALPTRLPERPASLAAPTPRPLAPRFLRPPAPALLGGDGSRSLPDLFEFLAASRMRPPSQGGPDGSSGA